MINAIKGKKGFIALDAKTRFLQKINFTTGCWEWIGAKNRRGYGQFYLNGKLEVASRASVMLFIGPIPKDLYICHHCDNPGCVRPDHLFTGTPTDNFKDAVKKGRINPSRQRTPTKTCMNGHPWTKENERWRKPNGERKRPRRHCEICRKAYHKKRNWK